MKPPRFGYHDPYTLAEAIDLLASLDNAKLLAGGQSLMPMLNMRYVLPDHIVDLNRVSDLSFIREHDGHVEIGAMTRQRELEKSQLLEKLCPLMRKALRQVGHQQTRNRGTIGGSLCHLDPAAELPAVAAALDATVHVSSLRGSREIPIAEFPAFYMTPSIEADEIVTLIKFKPWPPSHTSTFIEFSRRPGDFAVVGVAALMDLSDEGVVRKIALATAGLGPAPQRCTVAEEILMGLQINDELISKAADTCQEFKAMEDIHASADYRRHLASELIKRAVDALLKDRRAAE